MKIKSVLFAFMFLSLSQCGYNSLQGADENVKAAWSEVENQYQRRMDLVPQLVSTVKGSAAFEKGTLLEVIEARSNVGKIKLEAKDLNNPELFKQFQKAQAGLGSALSRLLVTVERYPDIKTTQAFLTLQSQLEGTENRIAVARKRYITSVAAYNKKVRFFPTNLTAKYLLGMTTKETFAAPEGAETAPKIDFK